MNKIKLVNKNTKPKVLVGKVKLMPKTPKVPAGKSAKNYA